MVFGRRKSSAPAEPPKEENEIRAVRNRLSKPQTIKSATNLPALAAQDVVVRTNTGISERVAMLVGPKAGDIEARRQIRSHLLDADSNSNSNSSPNKSLTSETSWSGVAYMINKFENNQIENKATSPPPISPVKARRPLSVVFGGRRFSGNPKPEPINTNVRNKTLPSRDEISGNNTPTPGDRSTDSPLAPSSRPASFAPGAATRSATRKSFEVPTPPPEPIAEIKAPPVLKSVEEEQRPSDQLSFTGRDDEDWLPPPQEPRTETPQHLDYTHLGSLHLGSLRVTNGRSSPALSAFSKNPLSQVIAATRDISSEYNDSVYESVYDSVYDEPSQHGLSSGPQTPQAIPRRDFSWASNRSSRFDGLEKLVTPSNNRQVEHSPNRASVMAAEYMAELPASPYSAGKSSPVGSPREKSPSQDIKQNEFSFPIGSTSPATSIQPRDSFESFPKNDTITILKARSDRNPLSRAESVHRSTSIHSLKRSISSCSLQKSHSMNGSVRRSISPISSIHSSTGSVLRINTKAINFHNPAFEDEALGHASDPERSTLASWHSPIEPVFTHEEAFSSAVEFQISPSPQRQPSPIRLELPKAMQQSDSGYSSNNSLMSVAAIRKEVVQPPVKVQQSSFAEKMFRPILKSRKTAPAVPTFSELKPATTPLTMNSTLSPVKSEPDQSKDRKKLVKKRAPWKLIKEITVQKVQTIDDSSIPPIPAEFQSNLRNHAKEVPELEKTFKSQHHISNRPSIPTMNLLAGNIRFPSPGPQDSPPARRKSWRSRSRESKRVPVVDSGISQQHAMAIINDSAAATVSLGGSPYELAINNPTPRAQALGPRPQPGANVVVPKKPRPKSMMDDRTATAFARTRSKSIHERDTWDARRASFNDRGGIPGKNLRPASITSDAPPVPAMPSPEVLVQRKSFIPSSPAPPPPRRSPQPSHFKFDESFVQSAPAPPPRSRRPSHVEPEERFRDPSPLPRRPSPRPSYFEPEEEFVYSTPAPAPRSSRPSYIEPQERSRNPSPIPPRHSPRPRYVEQQQDFEQSSPAPPPPSHSPRPMEVELDPWASQAAAWKARRLSAGHALKRRSWASNPHEDDVPEQAIEDEVYPTISPRQQSWEQSPPHHRKPRPHSMQPWDYSHNLYRSGGPQNYSHNQFVTPHERAEHSRPQPQYYTSGSYHTPPPPQDQYYPSNPYDTQSRALPQPVQRSHDRSPARPRSQAGSFKSFASSIAEELHPNKDVRPQLPPEFGRYSGGLSYEFDRGVGFGGSTGTRSVSGKADGQHRGVPLRSSHGVDLGDIPVIGVMKRAF